MSTTTRRRLATGYWWLALAMSVAVSSYGNIRHATGVAPADHMTEAQWIAGSLPVVLLVLVEGIAIGVRAGIAGWQRWMATGFVAILAAVVLASSYVGLLSLVRSTELFAGADALNLGLAAVPDLLMVAATVYVMTLRSPADGEAATQSSTAWSRIGGNLLARVEQASAPPTGSVDQPLDPPSNSAATIQATSADDLDEGVAADAPTTPATGSSVPVDEPAASGGELSVSTPTSVTDERDELVADELAATARRAVDLGPHPGDDRVTSGDELTDEWVVDPPTTLADERRRVDADDPTTGTDELATTTPTSVTYDPGELVADELAATPTSDTDEWRRRADDVLATSQIAADADELATVLRMADAGASKQAIADSVGRSRSTVSGWLRVAGADGRSRHLAAVSE
ncbi:MULTISPECIES: helix-turn-helix domain-containing protein [Gordonia]|uniref:helix-turn-helix domain-containing protein n=1 Tax=Gordonia TaxID=2053 RepID=UPI00257F1467|nr:MULTISPECIES: helix-turn-helix domain-containing protein [Gordonia]